MSRFNFYEVVSVDGYSFERPVRFGFTSDGIMLLNRGSYIIQYSFDGSTVHGDLDPSDASIGLTFDNRHEGAVYFRAVDGYGDVRVEAWGSSGRDSYVV